MSHLEDLCLFIKEYKAVLDTFKEKKILNEEKLEKMQIEIGYFCRFYDQICEEETAKCFECVKRKLMNIYNRWKIFCFWKKLRKQQVGEDLLGQIKAAEKEHSSKREEYKHKEDLLLVISIVKKYSLNIQFYTCFHQGWI